MHDPFLPFPAIKKTVEVSTGAIVPEKYSICWSVLYASKETSKDLKYGIETVTREKLENHKPRNRGPKWMENSRSHIFTGGPQNSLLLPLTKRSAAPRNAETQLRGP